MVPVHWTCQWKQAPWQAKTHTWQHQPRLEYVSGMGINRHWSRHAFRDIPKAQYTFKSLLVHGILQFTMLITLRCALHRCSSRDIRRWKLCSMRWGGKPPRAKHIYNCVSTIMVASQHWKTVQCWSTTREAQREKANQRSTSSYRDS